MRKTDRQMDQGGGTCALLVVVVTLRRDTTGTLLEQVYLSSLDPVPPIVADPRNSRFEGSDNVLVKRGSLLSFIVKMDFWVFGFYLSGDPVPM